MKKLYTSLLAAILLAGTAQAQIPATLVRKVTTGNDDAEQRLSTGAMDLTSSDLEITTDGSNNQLIGIRFSSLNLPAGVRIDSAYIQFSNKNDKAPVNGNAWFFVQNSLSPATFSATANDISSRSLRADSVLWPGSTDASWGTGAGFANARTLAQRSPDLKALVQAMVDQAGWAGNNPLCFVIKGSGVRNAQSFNGSATFAPELIVHYTATSYSAQNFPLMASSAWKYFDSGFAPLAWQTPLFADNNWRFGLAPMGYGETVNTTLSFGTNPAAKHITSYLRTQVNMTNTSLYDTLVLRLRRDDGAVVYINGLEVARTNLPAGLITPQTLALSDVSGADEQAWVRLKVPNTFVNGTNTLAVEIRQASAGSDDLFFDMEITGQKLPMAIQNLPIAKGSQWYFLDNGVDMDSAWRQNSFYEGDWNYGPAKLGYSDNAVTTLGFGPNSGSKYITYYFRKKFNVANLATVADTLNLFLLRDDGAVVYINNQEVLRSNMPAGPINFQTTSVDIVDGAEETTFYAYRVPKNFLVNGTNVVAVEIHQRDGTSSDLGFDMELLEDTASITLLTPAPGAYVTAGTTTTVTWRAQPSVQQLNLELSTNGGQTFATVATNLAANARSYNWQVPNTNASNSRLRLVNAANASQADTTDASFWIYPTPVAFDPCADPNHVGCFTSVQPMAQTQTFRLPAGSHRFQRIAKTGDLHSLGGTVGGNNDFTAYVGRNGSSVDGALGVNFETDPGGVGVFYIRYIDSTKLWRLDSSGAVDFAANGLVKTIRNCSGGITPWGTIVTSEESYNLGDLNLDGMVDVGWNVEYNPWTRQVMDYNNDGSRDKLWAMGRMSHENVVFTADSTTAYYAEDGNSSGLYKFVATQKGNMTAGNLFVMKRTGTTGEWIPVPNTTPAQQNTISSVVAGLGATNFNGAEDVEINPLNGMIYFTSKGNSIIYRFTDNGSTVSNFENYVGNSSVLYKIGYGGTDTLAEAWGSGIDNLVFDNKGNLWAQQDGGRNHLWVIRPDHTPFNPKVELFATTPAGCEPTGLTFSPDYRFGFVSFQHPSNNTAKQADAAGDSVMFNTHTTVVFGHQSVLGRTGTTLPLQFLRFAANAQNNQAQLVWEMENADEVAYYLVEQSQDGQRYQTISRLEGNGLARHNHSAPLLVNATNYFRIKAMSKSGQVVLSQVVLVRPASQQWTIKPLPNPFKDQLAVQLSGLPGGEGVLVLRNAAGVAVAQQAFGQAGNTTVRLNTAQLPAGNYVLTVYVQGSHQSISVRK